MTIADGCRSYVAPCGEAGGKPLVPTVFAYQFLFKASKGTVQP